MDHRDKLRLIAQIQMQYQFYAKAEFVKNSKTVRAKKIQTNQIGWELESLHNEINSYLKLKQNKTLAEHGA